MSETFWTSLARNQPEVAIEIARRITVPLLTATFEFDQDELGEDSVVGEFEKINLTPDTPTATLKSWNLEQETSLVAVRRDEYCLVRTSTMGAVEWRACGQTLAPGPNQCSYDSHVGRGRPNATILDLPTVADWEGSGSPVIYLIRVPTGKEVTKRSFINKPGFVIDDFPPALRDLNRHELLLTLSFKPRLFRFLLANYPGRDRMMALWTAAGGIAPTP